MCIRDRLTGWLLHIALSSLSDWHCCFSRSFSFYQILLLLFQFPIRCTCFFYIYTQSIQTYVSWVGWVMLGQLLPLTLQEGVFEWMKRLCAINPPVGQPDRLTRWVDEAVIIVGPALRHHLRLNFGTSRGKDFWEYSHYYIHTCWISQIYTLHV